jgi:hypothetical protein
MTARLERREKLKVRRYLRQSDKQKCVYLKPVSREVEQACTRALHDPMVPVAVLPVPSSISTPRPSRRRELFLHISGNRQQDGITRKSA